MSGSPSCVPETVGEREDTRALDMGGAEESNGHT